MPCAQHNIDSTEQKSENNAFRTRSSFHKTHTQLLYPMLTPLISPFEAQLTEDYEAEQCGNPNAPKIRCNKGEIVTVTMLAGEENICKNVRQQELCIPTNLLQKYKSPFEESHTAVA